MHKAILRKVGGSVMLALPRAMLEQLDLAAGAAVEVVAENGRVIVTPRPKPSYTMDELLAVSEYGAPLPEEREWVDAAPTGREPV